jgi:zinc/manganese transport system substrate-binding protein
MSSTSPVRAAALCLAGLVASGCSGGGTADASPVLATTTIWADITEQLACGEVEVRSLVPAGADAHSHEPTVRDADALREAQLVVANGLGLEGHLQDALDDAAADGVEVHRVADSLASHAHERPEDASAHDDEGEQGHDHDDESEHGHDHGGEDPHLWMDPLLVAEAAPGIAAALAEVDGLDMTPAELDRCAQDYVSELERVADEVGSQLAHVPAERRQLVTDHEALGHFAARFDLRLVGAVVPSTDSLAEANPRDLDELEATMRAEGVDVVAVQHGSSHQLSEALTDRLGGAAQVVELHVESIGAEGAPQSYVDLLRTNARSLAEAFGG